MSFHEFSRYTGLILTLLLIVGCTRRDGEVREKTAYEKQNQLKSCVGCLPQISSVSIQGSTRALVVAASPVAGSELRLTIDGGQNWTPRGGRNQDHAVTAAAFAEGGSSTWSVNRQGEVFTANFPAEGWRLISNLKAASIGNFMEAQQIEFSSKNDGWIRDLLAIWHTKDGGNTWEQSLSVSTPGVKGQPSHLIVIDQNVIVAAGTAGQIYRSEDGGRTWQINAVAGEDADFRELSFSDKQKGIAVGIVAGPSFRPLVFSTTDGGKTWQESALKEEITPWAVSFIEDDIWLAGEEHLGSTDSLSRKPLLLHSLDGGLNWERVAVKTDDPFFSLVRFADREHGWLVGRDNLYRTEDGGKSWKTALSLTPLQRSN